MTTMMTSVMTMYETRTKNQGRRFLWQIYEPCFISFIGRSANGVVSTSANARFASSIGMRVPIQLPQPRQQSTFSDDGQSRGN